MAKCSFSIDITGDAALMITKANDAITNAGGKFSGDTSAGQFSLSTFAGTIAGNYTITGNKFEIVITDKPLFVSCSMIEEQLRKFL